MIASPPKQAGFFKRPILFAIVVLAVLGVSGQVWLARTHADAVNELKSGVVGYCLDDYQNGLTAGSKVVAWKCNGSPAQNWTVDADVIKHAASASATQCLGVVGNAQAAGSLVSAAPCTQAPGQVWLRDRSGYFNPNAGLCLTIPGGKTGEQLTIANCAPTLPTGQIWLPITAASVTDKTVSASCDAGAQGARVACYAEKEWTAWQSGSPDHTALLNKYTLNTSYEEWCADFVSYVYKEAGYPFSGGEAEGWDENNSNNIQNMGFTMHDPSSYTPKVGDVAYFDYTGGHVEIVVSGGKNPTFVYGNSAAIDPATGNGEMQSNTITNDALGQVTYYLSPN